jgi:putative lipase involved disintegration of autophagic bodies
MKYDVFVAGRWRNREVVKEVLDMIRASGHSAYCFIENLYEGDKVEFSMDGDIESVMRSMESLPQDDPFIKKVYYNDINAERNSANFLLVLPAGISGHVEAGAAYGMGKPCYAVGKLEKTETLYNIFDEIFPDTKALQAWLDTLK